MTREFLGADVESIESVGALTYCESTVTPLRANVSELRGEQLVGAQPLPYRGARAMITPQERYGRLRHKAEERSDVYPDRGGN